MSPAEFDALTEDDFEEGWKYELINGVFIVSGPPGEGEADPNEELGYQLRRYRDEHEQGSSLDATLPERYVYFPQSRRRPDRVIWAGLGRQPRPRQDVPAIVVEFVSSRRRDRQRDYHDKRRE